MRTSDECGLDSVVRVFGRRASYPGAVGAGRLLGRIRQVRLLALRGRQAGIVRRLRRGRELSFQFVDTRDQDADLLRRPSIGAINSSLEMLTRAAWFAPLRELTRP